MREIKFRAWDKTDNKMIGWYDRVFPLTTNNSVRLKEYAIRSESFLEYMQYTGLKDKTGVEIYEGDIVILKIGHKYIVEYSQLNAWFCLVQVTDVDGCAIDKVYTGGFKGQEMRYCEVIGNIYENPELLPGKDA